MPDLQKALLEWTAATALLQDEIESLKKRIEVLEAAADEAADAAETAQYLQLLNELEEE